MMHAREIVREADGTPFEDGPDRGRVLVFGRDTGGRYGLMEFVVAPRDPGAAPDFGPHRHRDLEETFLVRRGRLRFLLGDETVDLGPGDLVRAPPGVRHGFANVSGEAAELLVSFHPGGFEELFVRHRSDQTPPPSPTGFIDDARRLFGSEFEG
ncbi:MAG TPA: cupin domain-containing protein [Caulobacteraceae bacterium]|jgi:mannose-6-phosphate isomerase-like protein (cupin superfamily)|nr:cupin domain-containing protein [Caulobacteraceae bacterium]